MPSRRRARRPPVVEPELTDGHVEGQQARLARPELDPREALQLEHRSSEARLRVAHVQLDDLVSGAVTHIRDARSHLDRSVQADDRRSRRDVAELEARVAEAVAECVQGRPAGEST
jgi:hypothetical protein